MSTSCLGRELRALEEEDIPELHHRLHQQRSRGARLESDLAHARHEAATRKEVRVRAMC